MAGATGWLGIVLLGLVVLWRRLGARVLGAGMLLIAPLMAQGADVVNVTIVNQSSSAQSNVPITFGQPFTAGDVATGQSLSAHLSDGTPVTLQVDPKATHSDGSLRHAIVTAVVPSLAAGGSQIITLASAASGSSASPVSLSSVLTSGYDAVVSLTQNGTTYTASAKTLLGSGTPRQWLSGPLVSEWLVGGPVTTSSGTPHPHLAAYFYVRAYADGRVRTDIVVENCWTFVASPDDQTYDVTLSVGGSTVFSQSGLVHYRQARWHKQFWWGGGGNPQLAVSHDPEYLQQSRAIPNYAKGLTPSDSVLNSLPSSVAPMDHGQLRTRFADTGASDQIGPLPRWDVLYAVSGDPRAYAASLANASAGGSYSMHYRDQATGRAVSIADYPNLSLNAYKTGFPDPVAGSGSPWQHDVAHQASIGYFAYLISGDYYQLEEAQFWANYNMLWTSDVNRQYEKGVFIRTPQSRGKVWSLRSLADVASITPDDDSMKSYFETRVANNIDVFTSTWLNKNNLGVIQDYDYPKFSPWQNDWFAWVFGHMVELGYSKAASMRDWLSQWPTGRMGMSSSEFCYQLAPIYTYPAAAGPTVDTYYDSFRALYEANYPTEATLQCGSEAMRVQLGQAQIGMMTGYPNSVVGYYSNMQPGLATAVDAGVASKSIEWARFVGTPVKPDYNDNPIWDIVPRDSGVIVGTGNPGTTATTSSPGSSAGELGVLMLGMMLVAVMVRRSTVSLKAS